MKTLLSTLVALSLVGCAGSSSHEHDSSQKEHSAPVGDTAKVTDVSSQARTVEVACGSCIYAMPGVSGCKLAAKIDGTPVLVTGGELDAHTSGLCSGAKQASVKGELREGKFVATEVKLK